MLHFPNLFIDYMKQESTITISFRKLVYKINATIASNWIHIQTRNNFL